MVITKSFVDLSRVYQPGDEVDLPEARALEYERRGWGRIVKPKEQRTERRKVV